MDGGTTKAQVRTALFLFCGIGVGAMGFLDARVNQRGVEGSFRSLGGVDNDQVACRSFERLTGSPALTADLSKLTAKELRSFAGADAPDVVFMSAPCKAFSGLMSPKKAATPKYVAMARLAVDGVRLTLDAWGSDGPSLILFENVPRIASRGKNLLSEIRKLLKSRGYVTHEGSHDCGVVGGLAQHRNRFLLVARHAVKCPVFLFQPPKQRVRACGEVLETLPLPGDPTAGRMHRMPDISLRTWLRLAAIRPGKDWRDLSSLDGVERPAWARYRVTAWGSSMGAIAGSGTNSAWGVADVRVPWGTPFGALTATDSVFSIANLRMGSDNENRHASKFYVTPFDAPARTITGVDGRVGSGAPCIGDLRLRVEAYPRCYGVNGWCGPTDTITTNTAPGGGACSVADLRLTCNPWSNSGVLGCLAWSQPSHTVTGAMDLWAGYAAVADPRVPNNPELAVRWFPRDLDAAPPYVPVIPGRGDGSWHRPLTLLERAALQGIPTTIDGLPLDLEGTLSKVGEHIGNAVPKGAALAIAGEMLRTLILASTGAFMLSSGSGVWVKKARNGSFPLYGDGEPVAKRAKGSKRRARAAVVRVRQGAYLEGSALQ